MIDLAPILAKFPQVKHDAAANALIVPPAQALEVAKWLRDDPAYRMDYASNVAGVDYLPVEKKTKVKQPDGTEKEVVTKKPGSMEVVYHLYSMALKHGPVVVRMRTANRSDQVTLPSFTPVWRSCDFQEREIYDLYGIRFEGHPDLRRLLMWPEFKDHPMRKDYVAPDDYEWEPTPHDQVLARAKTHYPAAPASSAAPAQPEAKS